jgi:aminopeptidase N
LPPAGWEKQGTFVAPDAGLSFAARHQKMDAVPGAPAFDVVDYTLDLRAAMVTEDFGGTNRITLVLKSAADSVLLYQLKLTIDSVKVNGVSRPFTADDSRERLTIRLGSTRPAGDTLRVDVAYRRLPGIARLTDRLGYFYFQPGTLTIPAILGYTMSEPREARCWMPCYDEPWEKSTSSMNVTVPAGYVVGSNGRLTGTTPNGDGTVTWHWRESHQIATYLMCATISRWTMPTIAYARAPGDTIPLQYFAWAKDSVATANFLPTVRQMVINLGALFGPYPWDKYAMGSVTPFSYGGMEHQTITTMHNAYQTNATVVVHELAHQWWGDLVTCGSWPDIWLNESFATYAEALWSESINGFAGLRNTMKLKENFFYGSWAGAVYNPEGQGFNLFDDVVYDKGGWVLHTLRGAIGDSAFFRSLRKWRELYSEKSATTAEFQGAVELAVGKDMSWFFNEWIYGAGWPVYSFASRWSQDTLRFTIYQQQTSAVSAYRMPVQVRAYKPGHDTTFVVWDSLRVQAFQVPYGFAPDSVVLDPDGWIMKQRGTLVAVKEPGKEPEGFLLEQNYPNPFNPASDIRYQIPEFTNVKLSVFDILGREVAVLVDERQAPGAYSARFSGEGFASGVYLYRLQAGSFAATRKMLLLK